MAASAYRSIIALDLGKFNSLGLEHLRRSVLRILPLERSPVSLRAPPQLRDPRRREIEPFGDAEGSVAADERADDPPVASRDLAVASLTRR
jgi:hypothetical protein